jgi:hypothetical protein
MKEKQGPTNGLAIGGPTNEAEKVVNTIETLTLPAALLMAAESVSAKKAPEEYPLITSVYLHVKDGKGRVVSTDGHRMFIGTFPLPTKAEGGTPSWLRAGIMLSNQGMKAKIGLITKVEATDTLRISGMKGAAKVSLSDPGDRAVFAVDVMAGTWPDYERRLTSTSFAQVAVDAEGNPVEESVTREWQAVGINSSYLKSCGEVAKLLEAGLPAAMRTKEGMAVRTFGGGTETAPVVFAFDGWPGSLLVLNPALSINPEMSRETAAILAPAARLTIAALTAHRTRQLMRMERATTEWERQDAIAKAADFSARIAAVQDKVIAAAAALTAEKAKPTIKAEPKPEPEPQDKAEDEPEPQDERDDDAPTAGPAPKTRRTKINVGPAN